MGWGVTFSIYYSHGVGSNIQCLVHSHGLGSDRQCLVHSHVVVSNRQCLVHSHWVMSDRQCLVQSHGVGSDRQCLVHSRWVESDMVNKLHSATTPVWNNIQIELRMFSILVKVNTSPLLHAIFLREIHVKVDIGRGKWMAWEPSSADWTPMEFLIWGYINNEYTATNQIHQIGSNLANGSNLYNEPISSWCMYVMYRCM